MRLIAHELLTELSQQFTATKNHDIVAVRPKLYLHNAPTGLVKIQRKDLNGGVIDESNSVDLSTISSLSYFHGYVRFDLISPVRAGDVFTLDLVPVSGYSFSQSAFVAWLADFDLRKYTATYDNPVGFRSPLDLEFWEKRGIGMVRELEFADGFESSSEPGFGDTSVALADGATNQDVTDLIIDKDSIKSAKIWYSLRRANDGGEFLETGWLTVKYSDSAGQWEAPGREVTDLKGGDAGVTFTIVPATGQIQYSTTTLGGPNYVAEMKYSVVVRHSA